MEKIKTSMQSSTVLRFKYCSLIILVLMSSSVISQSFPDNPTQIQEIPPSPTMWEFEKYGNYPVSMHTGVPNISIPISTAQSGSLQVPVSLSYHASGIKVDQKASWAGLGWSLMGGGAITRTIRGSQDEGNKGYINYPYHDQGTFDPAYSNNYYETEEMLQGFVDTEPDIFSYNFLGYSGKFVFNHSESRVNATIALIPHNDLKITPVFNGSTISSFIIVTPEGIQAEFAYPETSSEYRKSGLIGDLTVTANSTWHLKELTAPNGVDQITFQYKTLPSFIDYSITSESESIDYWDPCSSNNYTINNGSYTPGVFYSGGKRLEKIVYTNGYILFNSSTNNRADDPNNEDLRLDAIKIFSSLNGIDSLIKSYEMEYDYFGTLNPSDPNPENTVRLELQRVYEEGADGTRNNPYEFFYKDSFTEKLPYRFSYSQDYWGYYNGKGNSSLVPRYQHQMMNGSTIYLGDANREVDSNYARAGIIEKIVYPTKGYSVFEFESNTATIIEATVPVQYITGGLRVKNISSFDSDDSIQWQKSYEYVQQENPTLSSGVYNGNKYITPNDFFYASSYYFTQTSDISLGTHPPGSCNTYGTFGYQTFSEGVSSSPSLSNNFATVFYSNVKEYYGSSSTHEGYKWYHYASTKDNFVQGQGPISFSIDHSWDRGQLLLEETFEKSNSNPITTTTYNYEKVQAQSSVSGFKPGTRFSVQTLGYTQPNQDPYSFRYQQYFLTYYEEPIKWKRLKSTITVHNGVSTQKDFYYDSTLQHINLVRSLTNTSQGEDIETKTYYPYDKNLLVGLTSEASIAVDELITQYRIATPIQTETAITDSNGTELSKSIQRTNYKNWGVNSLNTGNIISPKNVEVSKGTGSLEDRVIYHDYSDQGRPLEISKTNGAHVTYIWGYNKTYPIAKIEDATYSEISSQVANLQTKSNADNDRTIGAVGNEGALRAALTTLRNTSSLQDAMVTTYTYDPLIGITSITDPKGYIVYYEYDEFNRLKQVKDADGKILSSNNYYYKDQQ